MKEAGHIVESNKDTGKKRKRRRGGIKFSGSKVLRRMAQRRKESSSGKSEMNTPETQRGSVSTPGGSPFRLHHRGRSVTLETVNEKDENPGAILSPESTRGATRNTQSRTDNLDFDNLDEGDTNEDEAKVCVKLCTSDSRY